MVVVIAGEMKTPHQPTQRKNKREKRKKKKRRKRKRKKKTASTMVRSNSYILDKSMELFYKTAKIRRRRTLVVWVAV